MPEAELEYLGVLDRLPEHRLEVRGVEHSGHLSNVDPVGGAYHEVVVGDGHRDVGSGEGGDAVRVTPGEGVVHAPAEWIVEDQPLVAGGVDVLLDGEPVDVGDESCGGGLFAEI